MKFVSIILLFITSHICISAENIIEVSADGKFKDLESALIYIQEQKHSSPNSSFVIEIRGGIYKLEKGISLGKIDSNLTIRAAKNERVKFVGGILLDESKFQPLKDKIFINRLIAPNIAKKIKVYDLYEDKEIDLGKHSRHAWGPNMEPPNRITPARLYKNSERQRLARWPNYNENNPNMIYKHYTSEPRALRGYEIKIQSILDTTTILGEVTLEKVIDSGDKFVKGKVGRGGTFQVAFDRMKYWIDVQNIWVDGVFGSTWEWSYNNIESIDLEKRHITLAYPELSGICKGSSVRLPHFYFENIPEEIDQNGEYWIDRKNGLLYFLSDSDLSDVVLTMLNTPILIIEGASNINIEGLDLSYGRNHGIVIKNSRNITIDKCQISNFAKGGIDVSGNSVRVLNSHIHGVGAFGVRLNGGNLSTLEPANNEVVNCHIHDYGWDQKSQMAGVSMYGVGHRVAHNEIHDATHFAFLIRRANDVTVEFNEIYDLPKYHKFDGGALYIGTGSTPQCRGIKIQHNYFHNIPTIGVYPDNFSWGVEISGNVFQNVGVKAARPAVNVNGGGECRTYNNLMIDCVQMYWQGAREKEERWFDSWNPILEKYGNGKLKNTPHKKYKDFNMWLSKKDKEDFFRPVSYVYNNILFHPNHDILIESNVDKKTGIRDNSKVLKQNNNWATKKNPGIENYETQNYNLKSDALVFKNIKGFKPILFDKMGRLK